MSTVKISALNPLVSGSTCAAAVLPIVNDGVTEKISIDNLRGTLRGASNQGPANAALNGGINNAACRLGDSALGGQDNVVNVNMNASTAASGNYNYNGPTTISSGSLSTVIGGLRNVIDVASINIAAGYPRVPNSIINSVGSCITGSATSAYAGFYPIVGGDMVIGGNGNTISGPTANGNYANGLNTILGGYSNCLDFQNSNLNGSVSSYGNAIINSRNSRIARDNATNNPGMSANLLMGGYSHDIAKKQSDGSGVFNNSILGGYGSKIYDTVKSTIINGNSSCIERANQSSIIAGSNNVISGSSGVAYDSVIIGGDGGQIKNVQRAVVLGGGGVTASVANAAHVNQLVFKTGAFGIPTSNPNVAGQVWNDAGTLKISWG